MKILITGGAGFIGINASAHFIKNGHTVSIFDNFSRKGGKDNVSWLQQEFGDMVNVIEGDIRSDQDKMNAAVRDVDMVLHLAGQVAVTTSVQNPREDFDINALGTFNMLEAVRASGNNPIFIFSSTNKVYGGLEDIKTRETDTRYEFVDLKDGISEERNVDFHSPYGCSKGAADQYVRDYHRIYGLHTIVFRQSCIFGPRQFGIEDQGWLAWFIIALTQGKEISIYGNGKQVRDILYIDDLVRAFEMAAEHIDTTKGNIYNIGGGTKNTISIWKEFHPLLEKLFQKEISAKFADWRPGDQPLYVSNTAKARTDFGWEPTIGVEEGITTLFHWIQEHKELFN